MRPFIALLVLCLLHVTIIAEATPGHSGFGYVHHTGVFHRAGDDIHHVKKHIKRAAASVGDISGGISLNIQKGSQVHAPDVTYETQYVKQKAPVHYYKEKSVEVAPSGGFQGSFVASFNKNVKARAPKIKYETQHIKVDKPVEYEVDTKLIETPINKHAGFSGGFVANFEKNVGVKAPVVHTEYVEKPIEKNADFSGGFVANFEKNVEVKVPEVINEVQNEKVHFPVQYEVEEKVVEKPIQKHGGFYAGFTANFEKNAHVKAPDVKYETRYIKVRVPVEYEKSEEIEHDIVKSFNADVVASGSLDFNAHSPHKKIDVVIEKKNEAPQLYVEKIQHKEVIPETHAYVDVQKSYAKSPRKHAHGSIDVQGALKVTPGLVNIFKTVAGTALKVLAPLTKIGVQKSFQGSLDVGVNAPFTHVSTRKHGGEKYVNVQAPFTSVHTSNVGLQKSVHVKAPFVNVKTGSAGVRVQAPFVDVITGPKNVYGRKSVQIKLPFFNLHLG